MTSTTSSQQQNPDEKTAAEPAKDAPATDRPAADPAKTPTETPPVKS